VAKEQGLPYDIARTIFAVLTIGGLLIVTLWIMSPFLGALVWATMIVIVTWPLLLTLQRWLWGKRWLAVLAMTIAILLVFLLPFWFAADAIINYADDAVAWVKQLHDVKIPPPPDYLNRIPLVGHKISAQWHQLASLSPDELKTKIEPYVVQGVKISIAVAGTIGKLVVQILLTVVLVAILYSTGETAARGTILFGRRLAGQRGEDSMRLAAQAVRGVALGVVVTALVQSLLGGIGLVVAGVPFAAPLTAVMLMLCLAQLGPLLVMAPATIWMYWSGDSVWGTVLLVFTVIAGTLDNFLRPILIKRGADLPLLLIFAGVIGGLLSFGAIGLFIGPVVLAVAFRLMQAWVLETTDKT
jgi:predicted PurR-regulated permease PerM